MTTENAMADGFEQEVMRALGRIEGELPGIRADLQGVSEYTRGVSARVASLERSKSWLLGLSAGFSMIGSIVGFTLRDMLKELLMR